MRSQIPGPQRYARSHTIWPARACGLASCLTATDTDSREPPIAETYGGDLVRFTLSYRELGQPFAVTGGRQLTGTWAGKGPDLP